jgi:imidazolonepropionase-like amidohydrolase
MSGTLYREAAFADGRSPELRLNVSVLVEDGRIAWIRPTDAEPDPGDAEVVDAGGSTIVPGMVDSHSHLTGPGGSHWIDRCFDPPARLLEVAEHNADLQRSSGVRWARDVGAPTRVDPVDGRERALSLGIRDRWRGQADRPYVRAAGSWIGKLGYLPPNLAVDVEDADAMVAAAVRQLDDGADFVKLMLDGPDPDASPWTAHEVGRVVEAAHARGAKVTCHSGTLPGARVCAEAGVDSIEHGFALDADVAATMAERGVALSTTLSVLRSWRTFARTTTLERFTGEGAARVRDREAQAMESVRLAHRAGVLISAGTDFGGGSGRANHMAWEVEALVEAGLEPWEALAAATWHGGQVLGEPEAGTIREGGPPDFFLVHGDPLSEPAALWRVWRVAW